MDISEKGFRHESQLGYSVDFSARNLRLIELPKTVAEFVNSGGQLEIKGERADKDAVLCTDSQTFEIKKVENSNTLYLTTPIESTTTILGQNTAFYEVNFLTITYFYID